ncbi:MAG: hypothetical protein OXC91_02810 [Rhodobacteraceae bacterium]|nr:hypothetical protein [Paracoccaceae bacterium]
MSVTDSATPLEIGNLKTGQKRTRGALPFQEIQMDMVLAPDELTGQFPPTRFYDRDLRLTHHRQLARGNLQSLVLAKDRVPRRFANLFYRVPQIHASMLSLSPPEIEDSDQLQSVLGAATACCYSLLIHGCGWLWADTEGMVYCFDAARTYPLADDDGIAHVARYAGVDSDSSYPNMVKITRIGGDGTMQRWNAHWGGSDRADQHRENPMTPGVGDIGEVTEVMPPMRGQPPLRLCYGLPNGFWGTSMLEDMAALVCDVAEMYDLRSLILEDQSDPLLTYRIANADVADYQGQGLGYGDEDDWVSNPRQGDYPSPSQEERVRIDILQQRAKGALRLEDAIEDVNYVEYSGNLADIEGAIEQLHQELYMVHNLPSAFLSGDSSGLSGESLKRLLLPFYAMNAPLHRQLSLAINKLLDTEIEWPHIFDVLEPEPMNPEEVDDARPEPEAVDSDNRPDGAEGDSDQSNQEGSSGD